MAGLDLRKLAEELDKNPAVRAASDVIYDTMHRIGVPETKRIVGASVQVAFGATKAGLSSFVPPFFLHFAHMGLDAGMAIAEKSLNATIDRIATQPDPNPNTK